MSDSCAWVARVDLPYDGQAAVGRPHGVNTGLSARATR
jgi:hypothetical protein